MSEAAEISEEDIVHTCYYCGYVLRDKSNPAHSCVEYLRMELREMRESVKILNELSFKDLPQRQNSALAAINFQFRALFD